MVHWIPQAGDLATSQATMYPSSISSSGGSVTNFFFETLTGLGIYGPSSNPLPGESITPMLTWSSSSDSQATVANYAATSGFNGSGNGVVTFHQINANATITASLCTSLNGSAGQVGGVTRNFTTSTYPVTGSTTEAPYLVSILVSPYKQNYATAGPVNCYATGFYSDNTVQDLTSQVTWSLTHTSKTGTPSFDTTVPNQLNLYSNEGSDFITITASYNGTNTGQGTVTTSFP